MAEPFPVSSVRLGAYPPALALVYLWASSWLGQAVAATRRAAGPSSAAAWTELTGALILIVAVPVVSLVVAHRLGAMAAPTRRAIRARWAAHLAFASPSLLVAFGNYARILNVRTLVTPAWVLLWAGCLVAILVGGSDVAPAARLSASRRVRLRKWHALMAVALAVVFLLPHIGNHVSAIWSGATHIDVMTALRTVYRADVVEPLLVALLALQAASGLTMSIAKMRGRTTDVFQTLQTASGVYIVVFLFSHLAAAFSARAAHVDTNWFWLVGRSGTLLGPFMTVVPHYFLGPLSLFIHVACGVRSRYLASGRDRVAADRLATSMIALGAVTSVVIMAALFGIHVRQ